MGVDRKPTSVLAQLHTHTHSLGQSSYCMFFFFVFKKYIYFIWIGVQPTTCSIAKVRSRVALSLRPPLQPPLVWLAAAPPHPHPHPLRLACPRGWLFSALHLISHQSAPLLHVTCLPCRYLWWQPMTWTQVLNGNLSVNFTTVFPPRKP